MDSAPPEIRSADKSDDVEHLYAEWMAEIIGDFQLPASMRYSLLVGEPAQASYYYRSDASGPINSTLYNNLLSRRIEGGQAVHGVREVRTTSSVFTNETLDLFLQLRFAVSQEDRRLLGHLVSKTRSSLDALRPLWNEWVREFGRVDTPPVELLAAEDEDKDERALIEVTSTLQTSWIDPSYVPELEADPAYPYEHLDEFDRIFDRIPPTVPRGMRDEMRRIHAAQGPDGALTGRVAAANQTLALVRRNLISPSAANGGLRLSGSDRRIPGLIFRPPQPEHLERQLAETRQPRKKRCRSLSKHGTLASGLTDGDEMRVLMERPGAEPLLIPPRALFSFVDEAGEESSIFEEECAGMAWSLTLTVCNPTIHPLTRIEPEPLDLLSGRGWLTAAPVKEALENQGKSDVTGFVFDGEPPSGLGANGKYGLMETMVVSWFPELRLTLSSCDAEGVKNYFHRHAGEQPVFLGRPLGDAAGRVAYRVSEKEERWKLVIDLEPDPPYLPPDPEAEESLAFLLALVVRYPFA